MIPSLPIHSSLLITLIAGLFLAALIRRGQWLSSRPAAQPHGLTTRQARAARRKVLRSVARQAEDNSSWRDAGRSVRLRDEMDQPISSQAEPDRGTDMTNSPGLRINWGRTSVALIGLLAFVVGIGTAFGAWLTAMGWTLPVICALIFVAAMAPLQVAAARRRRRRRARVDAAMREAMSPVKDSSEYAGGTQDANAQNAASDSSHLDNAHSVSGEATGQQPAGQTHAAPSRQEDSGRGGPFDAMTPDADGHGGPDSLVTVDEDGLPENPDRLFGSKTPREGTELVDQSGRPRRPVEDWQPRQVPQPKYLVAEKAERPEPEPLEEPQTPTPSAETKLKHPAAPAAEKSKREEQQAEGLQQEAEGEDTVAPLDPERLEAIGENTFGTDSEAPTSSAQTGSGPAAPMDVGEVLKRRRA